MLVWFKVPSFVHLPLYLEIAQSVYSFVLLLPSRQRPPGIVADGPFIGA